MSDTSSGSGLGGVERAIGNTPLVRLRRLAPQGSADILAKLEYLSPGGSIKDRTALACILDAEQRLALRPGGTIVEATSGNMGLALAMVGGSRGYKVVIVMPADVPEESKRRVAAYGGEVVESPSFRGMGGAVAAARRLAEESPGSFYVNQFANPACCRAHRDGTGQEILRALGDTLPDAFVAGVGTGATLMGVGEALRERSRAVAVIAVEPSRSRVLSEGKPGPHRIVGIGADFVPPLIRLEMIDEILPISDEQAYETAGALAAREGLFVGPSSGANVAAALEVAARLGSGRTVVTVLPDGGERYLHSSV